MYQQQGERNFHSFYNLLYGASDSELSELGLKSSDLGKYVYINQGGLNVSNGMDDKQNYRLVNEAMRISNFDKNLIKTIWSLVASIVHLGNLKFESNDTDLNNNHHFTSKVQVGNDKSGLTNKQNCRMSL